MCKTDDGHECYNPMHEARAHAAKKLQHLLKYAGCEVKHVYTPSCTSEANELYD